MVVDDVVLTRSLREQLTWVWLGCPVWAGCSGAAPHLYEVEGSPSTLYFAAARAACIQPCVDRCVLLHNRFTLHVFFFDITAGSPTGCISAQPDFLLTDVLLRELPRGMRPIGRAYGYFSLVAGCATAAQAYVARVWGV